MKNENQNPQATAPESAFLQQARLILASRKDNPPYDSFSPQEDERAVHQYARELAIFHTPPARDANKIYMLAGELLLAVKNFERVYEDDMRIEWIFRDAIAEAGIRGAETNQPFNQRCFDEIIETTRGWVFTLEWLQDSFEVYLTEDEHEVEHEEDELPIADFTPRLLRAFLSPDARRIIQAVDARSGPVLTKVIVAEMGAGGVDRARVFNLLRDLRERGLLSSGDNGLRVADPELWAAVKCHTDPA